MTEIATPISTIDREPSRRSVWGPTTLGGAFRSKHLLERGNKRAQHLIPTFARLDGLEPKIIEYDAR